MQHIERVLLWISNHACRRYLRRVAIEAATRRGESLASGSGIGLKIIEDMGLLDDIWADWARPQNGVITAPEAPGHGLKIKPEVLADHAV